MATPVGGGLRVMSDRCSPPGCAGQRVGESQDQLQRPLDETDHRHLPPGATRITRQLVIAGMVPSQVSQSLPDRSASPGLSAGIIAWSHRWIGAAGSVVALSSSA